jgi:hypothetical protein
MSTFDSTKTQLSVLLSRVVEGKLQLPDFQRGWVWDDEHIRSLIEDPIEISTSLMPYCEASASARERLSLVSTKADALELLVDIEVDEYVVPRVKNAIRQNVQAFFLDGQHHGGRARERSAVRQRPATKQRPTTSRRS